MARTEFVVTTDKMPAMPSRIMALRRTPFCRVIALLAAVLCGLVLAQPPVAAAQPSASRLTLRISTPAVPDDWHGKMWDVFKSSLEKNAPGEFDVQIHLNGTLFKQGAEPAAMARGNLEMAAVSAFDLAKQVPAFSIFTAGYVIRNPAHQQAVLNGAIGAELFAQVEEKMNLVVLSTAYLGTRQLGLRDKRSVQVPDDLKTIKLRMPASREWLFLGESLGARAMPMAFGEVYLGLKTGVIDGQDNPLPSVRAAKFHEVLQQIVLTSHLVDSLFVAISSKTWAALTPAQRKNIQQAARAATLFNNENRLREESQILDFFKAQGLSVHTPNLAAFRQAVQRHYQSSDLAKAWPKGLLDRINATPP